MTQIAPERPVSTEDLTAVYALLEEAGLPVGDLDSARPDFVVLRVDGCLVAAGALQHFGHAALLRSVVVVAPRRGQGLGQRIVQELERRARCAQVARLFLLTQTAAEFFGHLGYRITERDAAPNEMRQSDEFRSLCATSAICMVKVLSEELRSSD